MTIDLIELRDMQQIYQRRALAAAGMPEAADYMAHAKRYGAMAETVERFKSENTALALRVKALEGALSSLGPFDSELEKEALEALSTSDRTSEEVIAEFLGEPVVCVTSSNFCQCDNQKLYAPKGEAMRAIIIEEVRKQSGAWVPLYAKVKP